MELIVLGSSSTGNCYVFRASDGVLIVECGIDIRELKKALSWRLNIIAGCLVSHRHKDHSKFIPQLTKCGIKVLALEDVLLDYDNSTRTFCKAVEPMTGYKVGGFKVFTLPVDHDVPCLGFVIEHAEMGKLLFVTDTMMLRYRIKGLTHIMLEANYSDEILQENIDNGVVPRSMRARLMQSHMELQTATDILKTTDLSNVSKIILLHLSERNGDAEVFKRHIEQQTGKPTVIAAPGVRVDLSNEPY